MGDTAHRHEGHCPRCTSDDIEREVIYQTTAHVVSGVVFFCQTCGLTSRSLAGDREVWFDTHRAWQSPAVPQATFAEFAARWPKAVGRPAHGPAEPLGPTLPVVP